MAIQTQGNSGVVSEVDGTTFRASRVTQRPIDYGTGGCYELEQTTGGYGALIVGEPLFTMRWTSATLLCVISQVRVSVQTKGAFAVSQVTSRELVIARSWTVSDTGGTAIPLAGNNAKKRASMASSAIASGDMRIRSTAIVPGTRTLDTTLVGQALGWSQGGFEAILAMDISRADLLTDPGGHDHPIVLVQNEGIIIQIGTLLGTGGVQATTVKVVWSEVPAY